MNQFELTLVGFDQRRQAFNPVTVVAVERAIDFSHLGFVDVATHHTVKSALAGLLSHSHFKAVDKRHGVFNFVL